MQEKVEKEPEGREPKRRLLVEAVRRFGYGVVVEIVEEITVYGQRLEQFTGTLPPGLVKQKFDPDKMGEKLMEMMDRLAQERSLSGKTGLTQNVSHVYMTKEEYNAAGHPVPGDYVKLTLEKVPLEREVS